MAETDTLDAPVEEDIRHDDLEYEPQLEPRKCLAWLNLLRESEKAFEPWNDHCDKIDKLYANLERLAQMGRDKEFQMFWANAEVIKPSIYATPPQPVVVTKFKDRRPVYQNAAEILQRCCTVAFDNAYINELMLQVRDDVALIGRGVAWCRYESGNNGSYYDSEKVCIDFKHRRDFLHSVSRCWYEVTWVAAASYLTRAAARKRFRKYSGDEYQTADYRVDRDAKEVGGADNRERAKFWEIWDKTTRRVVWVAEGCEYILDEDDAHLDLQRFFPCPKPAYGTLQRGSLVPVPDILQYRDQLEELNKLTGRIHALTDALQMKGFYPAGGGELADAIQTALKINNPGVVMVPVSNWAAFGGSKEVIIWMPIAEVAQTINQCVEIRKQIIQDIYEIMGLSDIMRGASDPRETLGAQTLKTQYGSSRIRDKQYELARIARDLVGITAEIICEKFDEVTIIEMSQTQLPTKRMKDEMMRGLSEQLNGQTAAMAKIKQLPQLQQAQQSNPQAIEPLMQQGQKMIEEGQKALAKIAEKPALDQVTRFLKDQRIRNFVLDIETDSTIVIDEQTEKQRRGEFIGMLAQLLPQLGQMIAAEPKAANLCGQILKFSVAPFRAGRELDGSIDDFVEVIELKADQPPGDDPATLQAKTLKEIETMKVQAKQQTDQQELQLKAAELQQKDKHEQMRLQNHTQIEVMKLNAERQDDQARAQQTNMKAMADREKHQSDMVKKQVDMQTARQKADIAVQQSRAKQQDMLARQSERQAAAQFKQQSTLIPRGP